MSEWKYRWNDQEVDEETYKKMEKEHNQWALEQQEKMYQLSSNQPVKPKKEKKK
jgi:hypothetical protein